MGFDPNRIILNDIKPYDIHNGNVYVAPDLYVRGEDITKEEVDIYHEKWIGRDDKREYPHFHCGQCYSEEFMFVDSGKVCKKCYLEGKVEPVFLCTPVICGSS